MMKINAELHSKLKLLEEELARSREEGQGSGQEVERLRAQVLAEQNRAAQEENKANEMGKVIKGLEREEEEKAGVEEEEDAREKDPDHRSAKLKVLATDPSITSTPPLSLRILLSSL